MKTYKSYEELTKILEAPFPIEAYSIDKSRGFELTTLQAQYLKDRLTEAFGYDGWEFIPNPHQLVDNEGKKGVIVTGTLRVAYNMLETITTEDNEEEVITQQCQKRIVATGGSEFRGKGQTISDPYKSAETEALSKATSFLGIGGDMYKGLIEPKDLAKPRGNFERAKNAISAAKTRDDVDAILSQIEKRKWNQFERDELAKLIENINLK